jgi:hypothetical protein
MISVQYSVKIKTILNQKTIFQQTKERQKGAFIGSSFIQFNDNNPISRISVFIQNLL